MKIGIDARLIQETGVGRYIKNLLRQLQVIDEKNEYVIFVKPKDVSFLQELVTNSKWKIVPANYHWHSISEQIGFQSLLMNESLDLMHFPYFSLPIQYKRPFVVTIHDLIIHHFPTGKASTLPLPLYHIKRLGYKTVLSRAISQAKGIIVPLHAVQHDLTETFKIQKEKIFVTEEGFDEAIRYTTSNKKLDGLLGNTPYFLYVGNAYPHKNVEFLIETFLSYTVNEKNMSLVLVGKKDYFYEALEKKYKSKHIIFLHDIPDGDLGYLYSHTKALISASKMEGFGLTPLEAMALSCPVILSDIPAFHEVCKDAALYFEGEKKRSLYNAMEKIMMMTKKERDILLSQGKERVSLFSWKKMAEETLKIYERCTGV